MTNKPLFIYDGDCGFCKFWIKRWQYKAGNSVEFKPYQKVQDEFENIPEQSFQRSSKMVLSDGEIKEGAEGVFELFSYKTGFSLCKWSYQNIPGFGWVAEQFYRLVASNRSFFGKVTHLLFGHKTEPSSYSFSSWLFQKIISLIYIGAFLSLLIQLAGLIGSEGILPAKEFLNSADQALSGLGKYIKIPTLGWIISSDWFLYLMGWGGILSSSLLFLNIAPITSALLSWVFYLSLMNLSQEFLSYQWDILLLEAGFLTLFIVPSKLKTNLSQIKERFFETSVKPYLIIFAFWWLAFRLNFESGLVKLASGDPVWRDLTALSYHYITQPIPNLVSWFLYQLPLWFHKISTFLAFVIELIIPFLFFLPRRAKIFGASIGIVFQLLIFATGNYTFFNLLVIAILLMLFDNEFWRQIFKKLKVVPNIFQKIKTTAGNKTPKTIIVPLLIFLIITGTAQVISIFNNSKITQTLLQPNREIANFHIINTYGLFADMTTKRPEIDLQYSFDGKTWKSYDFKHKPDDPKESPPQVAPHQPRVDWQMWFSALTAYRSARRGQPQYDRWLQQFIKKLLQNSQSVKNLLAKTPQKAPKYIRGKLYLYDFTNFEEKRKTGKWWKRRGVGTYVPPVTLKNDNLKRAKINN